MDDEDGIGMIEIVVAMFVLAILALSFLPVLTNNLTAAQRNSQIATATQLVSTQLEAVRAQPATCAAVASFASTTTETIDGRVYDVVRSTTGTCTAPGTAGIRIDVSLTGTTAVLATAQTRVYVGAES